MKFSSILAVTVLVAVPTLAAQAVVIQREEVRMSADVCQPALPAFDGNIRKRPLAMQNEGSANAFLTCAFGGVFNAQPSAKTVSVGFINNTNADIEANCTLVNARAGVRNANFLPKTITVPAANSAVTLLTWTGSENVGGQAFTYPAVSCLIPPGLGIQVTTQTYDEEIGN